ncbi:hypothetical protein [Arthrobacter sp. D2-10]
MNDYPLYREIPDPFQAVQVTRENGEELAAWCGGAWIQEDEAVGAHIWIPTLDTSMHDSRALVCDYILKNEFNGRFSRMDENEFNNNFELWPSEGLPPGHYNPETGLYNPNE